MSIPLAIVIGSCIISTGVYFGLSGRTPYPVSFNTNVSLTTSPASDGAKFLQLQPPAQEQLLQQVGQALDAAKRQLLAACPQAPGGMPDRFVIDVVFNAYGKQAGRGFSEMRGNTRTGLGACLSGALPILTIPPPGVSVRVEAPFSFP